MESLNSIRETTDVPLLVFAPISINLYLQVIAFHSLQNNAKLFPSLLNLMHADTSLDITIRLLLLFMPSPVWVKSEGIDWQSVHLIVQPFPPLNVNFPPPGVPLSCWYEHKNIFALQEKLPHYGWIENRIQTCNYLES